MSGAIRLLIGTPTSKFLATACCSALSSQTSTFFRAWVACNTIAEYTARLLFLLCQISQFVVSEQRTWCSLTMPIACIQAYMIRPCRRPLPVSSAQSARAAHYGSPQPRSPHQRTTEGRPGHRELLPLPLTPPLASSRRPATRGRRTPI